MPDNNAVNLFLDIDGVLISESQPINNMSYQPTLETILFFLRSGLVFETAQYSNQYVPPGARECMQWLLLGEFSSFIRTHIFSAGSAERNHLFITDLIDAITDTALQEDHRPTILSYPDTGYSSAEALQYHSFFYALDANENALRKDLSVKGELTPNTLLCDDRTTSIYPTQVKHYVAVPSVQLHHFDQVKNNLFCQTAAHPLFQSLNAIYYLVGLLSECIQQHQRDKEPLSEKIFRLHFQKINHAVISRYTPCFKETLFTQHRYYEEGLRILRQFNPNLFLITSETYQRCIAAPPTPTEIDRIQRLTPLSERPPTPLQRQPDPLPNEINNLYFSF